MKKIFQKIIKIARLLQDYLNGDFAYNNYLKHHQINHPKQKPLDKRSFFNKMQKDKWNKVNRCC